MAKKDVNDLIRFLLPYPEHVKTTSLGLRNFIWGLYPDTNELIYDNYNAVAFGWSLTDKAGDVFCHYVNFGFNRGSEILDPEKLLIGGGSLYRYIRVADNEAFPEIYIKKLLRSAYENAFGRLKPVSKEFKGETIVKSISPVKRRPV
jgi:hypothetical protein